MQTRWVGIDFGIARIGIAVSDPTKLIAMSLETLQAEKKMERTATKLLKFLEEYAVKQKCEIEKIVLGMPLLLNGKRGFLADEVEHFIEELKKKTSIPIETWDERLTTVQAERSIRETDISRKRMSKIVDSVTAVILLQNYLDAKRFEH